MKNFATMTTKCHTTMSYYLCTISHNSMYSSSTQNANYLFYSTIVLLSTKHTINSSIDPCITKQRACLISSPEIVILLLLNNYSQWNETEKNENNTRTLEAKSNDNTNTRTKQTETKEKQSIIELTTSRIKYHFDHILNSKYLLHILLYIYDHNHTSKFIYVFFPFFVYSFYK